MAGGQIVRGALLSWKCTALSLEAASGHEEVSGYEPRVSKFTCSVTTGRDRKRSSGNNQIGYSSITKREQRLTHASARTMQRRRGERGGRLRTECFPVSTMVTTFLNLGSLCF